MDKIFVFIDLVCLGSNNIYLERIKEQLMTRIFRLI